LPSIAIGIGKKKQYRIEDLRLTNECIETNQYILTKHAFDRQIARTINLPETLYVLKNGYEEKRKTCFDNEQNTWKYAIRGKKIRDESEVRVIVAFDETGMLIIL